jgi:hypothetical protein
MREPRQPCAHRWDRWRTVIPSFDLAGTYVGASIAELAADEPVTPGWTRQCGLCGMLQTAYSDDATRRVASATVERAVAEALRWHRWRAEAPDDTTGEDPPPDAVLCPDCGDCFGPRHDRSDCVRVLARVAAAAAVTAYGDLT